MRFATSLLPICDARHINVGLPRPHAQEYSCSMQQPTRSFTNEPAYDEDGRVVIKSTCESCGESRLVSLRDGSLSLWEARHECPSTEAE